MKMVQQHPISPGNSTLCCPSPGQKRRRVCRPSYLHAFRLDRFNEDAAEGLVRTSLAMKKQAEELKSKCEDLERSCLDDIFLMIFIYIYIFIGFYWDFSGDKKCN